MTLRSQLLPRLDRIRALPDRLGLRQFTVTVRVITTTGGTGLARPGFSNGATTTTVDTVVTVGGVAPKVRQTTQKDIVASGGRYASAEFKIGPLTPPFPGGGTSADTIDPAVSGTSRQIYWKLEGPGLPSGGAWFEKVGDSQDRNFHQHVYLKATGYVPAA